MAGSGEVRYAGSLSIGARVRWQEREWEVVSWQGPQVTLVPQDGGEPPQAVSYRWLVGAEDFAVLSASGASAAPGAALDGWERQEGREEAALWQARRGCQLECVRWGMTSCWSGSGGGYCRWSSSGLV
ncbi:hypothetical protein ACWEAF_39760, partial [Streptomyces sp. NPDC005071]